MDNPGTWIALLALIATNVAQLVKQFLDGRERRLDAASVREDARLAAELSRQVKKDLAEATLSLASKVEGARVDADEKMDAIVKQVEVVHKATNSIKDDLVASTAKASHAEGFIEGKAAECGRKEAEGRPATSPPVEGGPPP